MATTESPRGDQKSLKESVPWDPSPARRVAGISHRIDFSNHSVLKCYSTSMVFPRLRIFRGHRPAANAHFITAASRHLRDNHCTCSC